MKRFSHLLLLCFVIYTMPVAASKPSADSTRKQPWIATHLLNFTSDADLEKLGKDIPAYAAMGINLIILEVDYNFFFKSHPELSASDKKISPQAAKKFARICRENKIRLVPEFQCLGHQSWAQTTFSLLTKYPELDLTPGAFPGNKDIYCREWDPTNPKVNELIFPLIEEIVDAFEADGIHVGMDEVFLLGSEHSPNTKGKDPAELYAQVINELHDYFVKKKGLEMFMWGDRLIDGKKYAYGDWESATNGTAPAVDMIPKDIIICDWHYSFREEYPSIPMFLEKGFRVIPCSYIDAPAARQLVKYSLRQDHPNMLGHMFTSWGSVHRDSLLIYPAFTSGLEVFKTKKIWNAFIELEKANPDGTITVSITPGRKDLTVYFTTDGTEPDHKSTRYQKPVVINKTSLIKAVAYDGDKPASDVSSKKFVLHLAIGKPATFGSEPGYKPAGGAAGMVNGITSTPFFSDAQWAGFSGKDVEVEIDLINNTEISQVSFNNFFDPDSWIWPGIKAELWISSDGKNFKKIAEKEIEQTSKTHEVPVIISVEKIKTRYVKLVIPKRLIPDHAKQGAGKSSYIFIDEVVVR